MKFYSIFYHNCDIDNIINMKLILGHHKKSLINSESFFCVGCAHRHDTNDPAKISPSMIFNGRHRWMVVCAICRMCTQSASSDPFLKGKNFSFSEVQILTNLNKHTIKLHTNTKAKRYTNANFEH